MSTPAPPDLLGPILASVSRSFYLSLRMLPLQIRPQVSLAYLLARTADTIADTPLLQVGERRSALEEFRARIAGESTQPLSFIPQLAGSGTDPEQRVLMLSEESLSLLTMLAPFDHEAVRTVLQTIISGQDLDLERFGSASATNIACLPTAAELDDYTYRVAGCVGEFWTRLCQHYLKVGPRFQAPDILDRARAFGNGLQLTNILRDLPADLRQGRCYLPADELQRAGVDPQTINPAALKALRPVYDHYLGRAEACLHEGWVYTNTLPRGLWRLRLACAWPILIGLKTIQRLRALPLDASRPPVKISRPDLRQIVLRSMLGVVWPPAWRKLPIVANNS